MARFFVNRPIVAIVLSIILVLLGVVAMQGLPIAQYPEIVPPMVQVTTTFIGASATDVEASVATPLEQKINGVEKGIYMKSTNANDGTLTLKVSFEVGSNQDMDNVFTQNRVSEGHAADAAVGQELRRHGEEGAAVSAPGHLGEVAERHLRQQLPLELHDDQHQRHDRAHSRRRADQPVRRQRLRDANLAASRSHRAPRHHHSRHRQRDQLAEPADPGRPDRRSAGRDRHRVHLHRSHAGPPAERGGIRQHHPPHQSGRLGSPHQGRRPHRARDDALQRGRPPRRQAGRRHRRLPDSGHQRGRGRQQHQGDDGRSEEALPARHGLPDLARHDAAGHRGDQRDRPHAVRSGRARHHRRVHLPAELARDAHPADDGAGLARRRVHLLPDARLLDQRALAARPRPRHRHRRGRCDRRGRGGDAPHRARDGAEGGDDQGDGGGVGPGHRDRPHPHRGVRAGRLHGRHHRAAVSAVRDHDRAVGAAVGRQRADAQPGAGGHAAQGADRQEDAAHAVLQRLQQGVRRRHRRLRELRGHPGPEDVPEPRVHRRADLRDRRPGPADSRRLRAGRGPGLHHGQRPAARRGVARAHRRRDAEGRGDPGEERGDRGLQHDQRLLAAHLRVLLEHGLLLRAAQAVGGAQDRRGARPRKSSPR